MTVMMPLLMAYSLIGELFHEIAGSLIFILFIVHHILNRKWYSNVAKGKYNASNPSKSALEKCEYHITAVIYYMNLGYDYEYLFQFIREYFDEGEEFFMDAHHPLFVRFVLFILLFCD